MPPFLSLPKLSRGDHVALLSPSAGLPGLFPWVLDLGVQRLRDVFGLHAVEYPTTRVMGASLEDRARDVMAAFANPDHKAVFASIGGNDQVRLLPYLDAELLRANPKPFFGFSDNTHLHAFLWNLGIPSYYGGAIMTQLAMPGQMHEFTVEYLTRALFAPGEVEVCPAPGYTDQPLDWADPANLRAHRPLEANEGLYWDGTGEGAGPLWGGCVESLLQHLAAGRYLPAPEHLRGAVLYLETSECLPPTWVVASLLTGLGERGWLAHFQAVLVGRPQAWSFDRPLSAAQKAAYRHEQRDTVLQTVRRYTAVAPVVQNVDFGHTDPQIVIPSGQWARVLGSEQRLFLQY